jgi:hypothetical protein
MTQVWQRTPDGYERDGYRIRLMIDSDRARWQLAVNGAAPGEPPMWCQVSYHRRLRSAQYRAASIEREGIARQRITWRAAAGSAAMLIAVTTATSAEHLGSFIIATVTFALALRYWIESVVIRVAPRDDVLAHSWPRLEPWALSVIDFIRPRASSQALESPPTAVRVLPPEPEDGISSADPEARHPAGPMHVC